MRRVRVWLAVGACGLALGGLAGCGDTASAPPSPATVVPGNGATLDVPAFRAAVARPGTVVLDVRTPGEFAQGHLVDAVNIGVEDAGFDDRVASLDRAAPYAVYCRSGRRSGVAVQRMVAAGFTHVVHLGGGIGAWTEAGGEVVTG